MKIQYLALNYGNLTGSELYVYDLARKMVEKGHEVYIDATNEIKHDTRLYLETIKAGINIGSAKNPDIVHMNQVQTGGMALAFNAPIVQTVHSEILPDYEAPFLNKQVKTYIAIRDTIPTMFPDIEKWEIIVNGVDENKFKPTPFMKEFVPTVLFVGSNDFLRENAIINLVERARLGQIKLILVGKNHKYDEENIVSIAPMFEIEHIVSQCDLTASVLMGRTTIEGWMCGKSCIIYMIDMDGFVEQSGVIRPPKDMSAFKLSTMVERIEKIYQKVRKI